MGKKSGPAADPRIGIAAMMSAQTGQDYLAEMKRQAAILEGWGAEDRSRYKAVFQPIEDQMVADAASYDSPERRALAADQAGSDVRREAAISRETGMRALTARGVNPASGRFGESVARAGTSEGLAVAGARNTARRQVEAEGYARRGAVTNIGRGMAVNPGTSMGMASGNTSAGFNGAMQGYNQQANILQTDYQNRREAWASEMGAWGSLAGAAGSVAGAFLSSKEVKHDKKAPKRGALLEAVKKMPVEEWTYNEGQGDGQRHVGPYAEDFAAATGRGTGKQISIIDAIGVTMGAIKDLAAQVDAMAGGRRATA